MRLLKTFTAVFLLSMSLSSFAYVPDLFGAYERGTEQARQDNARDTQYGYQYARPAFVMGVYADGKSKPKMMTRLSIKKRDAICWMLYNVPTNTPYSALERFTMPVDSDFAGSSQNKMLGKQRISSNTIEFYHTGNSGNSNQFENCWTVAEGMPLGTYQVTITVGKNQFHTQSFQVVK